MSDYFTQRRQIERCLSDAERDLFNRELEVKECKDRIARIEGYISEGKGTEWLEKELSWDRRMLPVKLALVDSSKKMIAHFQKKLDELQLTDCKKEISYDFTRSI